MWVRTEDLHEILTNDTPGSSPDPTRAATMRAFDIPSQLANPLSSSEGKTKIIILAVWQGLRPSAPVKTRASWVSEKSLILVDHNRLATMTIIPLENPATSRDSLRPGNEVIGRFLPSWI